MAAPIVKWICSELSNLLGFDATEDIAKYILAIDTAKDMEDYMCDLLDTSKPRNKRFVEELIRRWRPQRNIAVGGGGVQVYRKADEESEYIPKVQQSKGKKKGKKPANSEREESPVSSAEPATNGFPRRSPPQQPAGAPSTTRSDPAAADAKKRTKFVPLFSEDGETRAVAKLPGRHRCDCQAAKHPLISNCVDCGRVVCDQEGAGPCLFCGALVCSPEQQEILSRGSKKSDKLRQVLMSQGGSVENRFLLPNAGSKVKDGLERAAKHKDKLLEYDRTATKRTQVIDDESDYFATDSRWLSQEEREALRQREAQLRSVRHASRKDRKITLDIAGRRVTEDNTQNVNVYDINDSVVQEVYYGKKKAGRGNHGDTGAAFTDDDFGELVNPGIQSEAPQFVDTRVPQHRPNKRASSRTPPPDTTTRGNHRLQDPQLQEMCDEGVCMSMHQPWASLLVHGIKRHEGRSWYSAHRGRLWIAATAKAPTDDEVCHMEEFYRSHYPNEVLRFPDSYPVSCLLGCVDVTDVLDQDTYIKKFPGGESSSPFVFICQNPQQLIVKFPIKGKHKIYKLDHHIHQGAKKGLRKS